MTRIVELLAKLRGELQAAPQVNLMMLSPLILTALQEFPEAKQAVARRLQELEAETVLPAAPAPGGTRPGWR